MVSDEGSGTRREAMAEPPTVNVNRLFFNELVFAWRSQRARIAELEARCIQNETTLDADLALNEQAKSVSPETMDLTFDGARTDTARLRGELAEARNRLSATCWPLEELDNDPEGRYSDQAEDNRAFLARTGPATEGS